MDFRQSDGDKIDVSAYGYTDFSDLQQHISGINSDADTLINFGGSNSVTLIGVDYHTLVAADFDLA
jgi:hypothetical protein